MNRDIFLSVDIPKNDYYANMYDIENLTSLSKREKTQVKNIKDIEDQVLRDNCEKAQMELEKLISKDTKESEIYMLYGALTIKNIVLEGKSLSPKHAALQELKEYLRLPEKEISKKMLVEVPVAEEWKKFNPDITNEEEINNFYSKTDAYVFELMAANHIIQTLYSYFILTEKLKKLKVKKIIDYGAGAGTLCILFKKLGYDIDYADLPGKLSDFAKWRFEKRNIEIPMIDMAQKPIDEESYDCIISTEVIEHVVNPIKLLELFSQTLKGGGVLVVSESCEYIEDFSSHLESNRKYGGKEFIDIVEKMGFKQVMKEPFIPQLIFIKQ